MFKGVIDAFVVVGAGAKLWLRHWPVLLSISLFAMAGRMGAQWAAVRLSDVYNTLGVLTLALAPMAAVTGIILMLYALRHSLPALNEASDVLAPYDPVRHRERTLLDMLASVLVPFLAVYASYGFLKEDINRYLNTLYGEEFAQNDFTQGVSGGADTSRFDLGTGWVVVAVVVVAVLLKFGLAKLEGRRAWWGLGLLGAYVEGIWLITIAAQFTTYKDLGWAWVQGRRGVEMFVQAWESLLGRLGPFAEAVDTTGAFVIDVLASVDSLVVVPVAWLTVGAVVYGHKLVEPPVPPQPRVLRVIPGPVRRWGGELAGEVTERFTGLIGGLRQLAVAGLAPMLIFSLAFLAAQRLEDGLNELARWVIGPQTASEWLAFQPHVQTLTRSVGLTVTVCLLAAAVERVLASGGAVAEGQKQPEAEGQPAVRNEM